MYDVTDPYFPDFGVVPPSAVPDEWVWDPGHNDDWLSPPEFIYGGDAGGLAGGDETPTGVWDPGLD